MSAIYNYNGINFDDSTKDEDGNRWSQLCEAHKEALKNDKNSTISDAATNGMCGVEGCKEEADYYIDFPTPETV